MVNCCYYDLGNGLPWLLLAAWEVFQTNTGSTTRELLFRQKVHGALVVLQDGSLPEKVLENLTDSVEEFGLKLCREGKLIKQKLEILHGKI